MASERIEPLDPPGKEEQKDKTETKARRRQPGSAKLQDQVAELYTTIGMVVVTPIDRLAGTLLVHQAEEIAEQWVKLAETNPQVKKVLQKLVEAGGWGGIIVAHGMLAMPVLVNRGLFPDQVALPVALATSTQYPGTAELFTHPRFREQTTTTHAATNGTPGGWEDTPPSDSADSTE